MPPQNNVKTTLHPEILLPAKQSVSSRVWNQCCTLSSAHPHSFCFYLGKAVKPPGGLGWSPTSTEDAMRTWNGTGPHPHPRPGLRCNRVQGSRQPQLLCQQSRSLCDSQGRQEHLDIHVVDKTAWSFLLGCQAKEGEETRRNWNVRRLHHFLLISNVSFACDLQRHGKGVGQPAPPGRTKRKKSHGFQLPGDDVCWQQQNSH